MDWTPSIAPEGGQRPLQGQALLATSVDFVAPPACRALNSTTSKSKIPQLNIGRDHSAAGDPAMKNEKAADTFIKSQGMQIFSSEVAKGREPSCCLEVSARLGVAGQNAVRTVNAAPPQHVEWVDRGSVRLLRKGAVFLHEECIDIGQISAVLPERQAVADENDNAFPVDRHARQSNF